MPYFFSRLISSGVLLIVFGLFSFVIMIRDWYVLWAAATLCRYFAAGFALFFVFKKLSHCPSAFCHAQPKDCFSVQLTHANPENNFKYAFTSFLRVSESIIRSIDLSSFMTNLFCCSAIIRVVISNPFFL